MHLADRDRDVADQETGEPVLHIVRNQVERVTAGSRARDGRGVLSVRWQVDVQFFRLGVQVDDRAVILQVTEPRTVVRGGRNLGVGDGAKRVVSDTPAERVRDDQLRG